MTHKSICKTIYPQSVPPFNEWISEIKQKCTEMKKHSIVHNFSNEDTKNNIYLKS